MLAAGAGAGAGAGTRAAASHSLTARPRRLTAAAAAAEEEEDGREGNDYRDLTEPCGFALSRSGRELFVSDSYSDRVVVIAVADGSVVRSWAVTGGAWGLCVGPDGRLFVTFRTSGRLRKFS